MPGHDLDRIGAGVVAHLEGEDPFGVGEEADILGREEPGLFDRGDAVGWRASRGQHVQIDERPRESRRAPMTERGGDVLPRRRGDLSEKRAAGSGGRGAVIDAAAARGRNERAHEDPDRDAVTHPRLS